MGLGHIYEYIYIYVYTYIYIYIYLSLSLSLFNMCTLKNSLAFSDRDPCPPAQKEHEDQLSLV